MERLPKNLRRRATNERDRDAVIAAFEAAPDAPESLRERTIAALTDVLDGATVEDLADAAIAVICTPVAGAE